MKHSLLRASALVGAGAVALVAAAATPAFAISDDGRQLPAGDAMYSIDCGWDYPALQVFSIDSVTAKIAPVGSGSQVDNSNCAGTAATDPTTGVTYFVGWGSDSTYLGRIDLTTGAISKVADFAFGDEEPSIETMAIGLDGKAYAVGDMDGSESDQGLYRLDLTTAELTAVDTIDYGLDALAVDPATGSFVGLQDDGDVFSLDVANGAQLYRFALSDLFEGGIETFNFTIDSDGIFWFTTDYVYDQGDVEVSDDERWSQTLWSVDPANRFDSLRVSGGLDNRADTDRLYSYTEALFIAPPFVAPIEEEEEEVVVTQPAAEAPEKALAETGVDAATPIFLFGALGAALIGGVLLVGARFRRREV